MFPTHTTRRNRAQPPQQEYLAAQHPQHTASVASSWDYQSSPPYSTQYPGHTVPGYAYPSQHGGSSHGRHQQSTQGASHAQSGQSFQERAPYPQWNPTRIQRGYERHPEGSQDGNHLDGSHHSYPPSHSEGEIEYHQETQETYEPIQQRAQPDPSQRYQQYRYQSTEETNVQLEPSAEEYPSTQNSRYQSNRYYSQAQDTPADYQPYIPERTPRSFNNMTYNKWTPPPKLQQFLSPEAQLAQGVVSHQYPEDSSVLEPPQSDYQETHFDSHPQQEDVPPPVPLITQNGTNSETFYPGHPAYKWTPPVVLQVFQEQPLHTQQSQDVHPIINSKYASHSHDHISQAIGNIPVADFVPMQSTPQGLHSTISRFLSPNRELNCQRLCRLGKVATKSTSDCQTYSGRHPRRYNPQLQRE